ncbi:MAG TPA: hypothetical protein VM933_04080 [Acidimicrobiales bacterium]|nr:hypothetical protein [Acidimicrobiales bacterium]
MRHWLTHVVVALVLLLGLLGFYELAAVDTNIDTGNQLAIGAAGLVLVWFSVACLGAAVSLGARALGRRWRR